MLKEGLLEDVDIFPSMKASILIVAAGLLESSNIVGSGGRPEALASLPRRLLTRLCIPKLGVYSPRSDEYTAVDWMLCEYVDPDPGRLGVASLVENVLNELGGALGAVLLLFLEWRGIVGGSAGSVIGS